MLTKTALIELRTTEYVAATYKNAADKQIAVGERPGKAGQLVLAGAVTRLGPEQYRVQSQSQAGVSYEVNGACQCEDSTRAPGGWCKHRLAGRIWNCVENDVEKLRRARIPHAHRYLPCGQHTIPEVDCWQQACPDAVELPCPICSVVPKPKRTRKAKENPNVPPHVEAMIVEEGVPTQEYITHPDDEPIPYEVIDQETGEIVSDFTQDPEEKEAPVIQSIAATVKKVVDGFHSNGTHVPAPEPAPEPAPVVYAPPPQYEPAPVLEPRVHPLPEAPVSACFTLRLPDNHQLTYTLRGHTDAEVLARIPVVLAGLEKAITPEHGRLSWLRRIFVATFPQKDREDVSGK